VLVDSFADKIEQFRSLYRALAPEFAAARYKDDEVRGGDLQSRVS
jgi:hypothetical protein